MPAYFFKLLLTATLLLMPLAPFSDQAKVWATSEVVEFSDPLLRERYYQLVQDAPISKDMKAQIYTMLEAQNTDDQIKQHLVSRYSEFVLYRPEVNTNTWFLWFAPLCFVLLGGLIVWRYAFFGNKAKAAASNTVMLTESQQRQLSKLLGEDDKS
jgi:hypothetical protein